MNLSHVRGFALGLGLIAIFSGCGVLGAPAQLAPTASESGRLPRSAQPDRKGDLLYISDFLNDDVYVFSYPKTDGSLEGTLTGFDNPAGLCVDAKGDLFVTNDSAADILEYAHGGTKPIATLELSGGYPYGCSVDPATGNLAVTSTRTGVAIYADAKGTPTSYTISGIDYYWLCTYDDEGNLFVDGANGSGGFELAELPSGSSGFKIIALNQTITPNVNGSGVQWDGTHLAIGSGFSSTTIERVKVSGSKGKIVGSTPLGQAGPILQFFIANKLVIGPNYGSEDVGFWKYPAGGSPTKLITGDEFDFPIGAAVSVEKGAAEVRAALDLDHESR